MSVFAILLQHWDGVDCWNWRVMCQKQVSSVGTSNYFKISWSLEDARFVFRIVRSLWNLAGTSAALLPKCLSNFKAMGKFKLRISRLRGFTRSYDKTSYWILKRDPGGFQQKQCCWWPGAARGPEHQQSWYWPSFPIIFRYQHTRRVNWCVFYVNWCVFYSAAYGIYLLHMLIGSGYLYDGTRR